MPSTYIYVIPLCQALLYTLGFSVTYTLSVANEDIPAIFPYVSDTGAWSLEKCIFSFTMGVGALLMYITVYIRYRQVQHILESDKNQVYEEYLKKLNKISYRLTPLSVFGLFLLGCFQVWPYVYVHLTGAGLAFSAGWIVLAIQTFISIKMYPTQGSKCVIIARTILIAITGLSLNLTAIFGALSLMEFQGTDITQWTESSGGYTFHLISVVNEWITIAGIILYMALYTGEFKSIVLYKPKLELIKV